MQRRNIRLDQICGWETIEYMSLHGGCHQWERIEYIIYDRENDEEDCESSGKFDTAEEKERRLCESAYVIDREIVG